MYLDGGHSFLMHAVLENGGELCFVKDLGSKNKVCTCDVFFTVSSDYIATVQCTRGTLEKCLGLASGS